MRELTNGYVEKFNKLWKQVNLNELDRKALYMFYSGLLIELHHYEGAMKIASHNYEKMQQSAYRLYREVNELKNDVNLLTKEALENPSDKEKMKLVDLIDQNKKLKLENTKLRKLLGASDKLINEVLVSNDNNSPNN